MELLSNVFFEIQGRERERGGGAVEGVAARSLTSRLYSGSRGIPETNV